MCSMACRLSFPGKHRSTVSTVHNIYPTNMRRYTTLVSTPPYMYFNLVYPQIRVDIINTSIDVVVAKFNRKYEGNQCVCLIAQYMLFQLNYFAV